MFHLFLCELLLKCSSIDSTCHVQNVFIWIDYHIKVDVVIQDKFSFVICFKWLDISTIYLLF